MNLNSPPSPFPMHHDQNDHHYLPFAPNQTSCHFFFNSTTQDHNTQSSFYNHPQFNYPPHHNSDENYDYDQGGSTYEMKNKVDSSLKLTLWKKEDHDGHKWMSSKMRVMEKMKIDDRKRSSSSETEISSNTSSYNNNTPIRVCADCNTTKTPLWRSGPKGPKSLCNACGIRQRKARRAMAAAAAAAAASTGTPAVTVDRHQTVKIKVQHKERKNGHSSQFKKRTVIGSPSNGQKKTGFEDFLIKISNNLSFHRVFPEDEKDAAILLMALSSGLVNG